MTPMKPSFSSYRGKIFSLTSEKKFLAFGEVSKVGMTTLEVTELPPGVWTEKYKERLQNLVDKNKIVSFESFSSHDRIKFVIKITKKQYDKASKIGIYEYLQLITPISFENSLLLFDGNGKLRDFGNTLEILEEHFEVRYKLYEKRHAFLLKKLSAEVSLILNKSKFINMMLENKIEISGRSKKDLIKNLKTLGFVSDPVKQWKFEVAKNFDYFRKSVNLKRPEDEFSYLLDMSFISLTSERMEKLESEVDSIRCQLIELESKKPEDLWLADLKELENGLERIEKENARKIKKEKMSYIEPSPAAKLIPQELTPRILKKYDVS